MRDYIGIILLMLSCTGCTIHNAHMSPEVSTVQGYAYDRVSGDGLNGTFIQNLTRGITVVSDSVGRFKLTANVGDSICFRYVGMRDSVMVMSRQTPSWLQVGLDTINTTLIDKGVHLIKPSSRSATSRNDSLSIISRFSSEYDGDTLFYYFNDEWIPGADINMICEDSISKMDVRNDKYGNKAVFVTLSPDMLHTLKTHVDEVYKDVWVEYDPVCEFPGGAGKLKEWLKDNMRIPEGFKGRERVVVGFKVKPDGTVFDGHIIRQGKNESINNEAMRLVNSLPRFYVKYYTPVKEPIFRALPILFQGPD